MKKSLNRIKVFQLAGMLLLFSLASETNVIVGQATTVWPTNIPSSPTDFLGWNAGVGNLQIRHDTPDQPIIFSTNGLERMRIRPDRTKHTPNFYL